MMKKVEISKIIICCYPILEKYQLLIKEEEMFNKIIQAYRSKIETRFADIGYKSQQFHNKSLIKVSSSKIYNLQFKVVCLLMNIQICGR